jgi:hypothetical protein
MRDSLVVLSCRAGGLPGCCQRGATCAAPVALAVSWKRFPTGSCGRLPRFFLYLLCSPYSSSSWSSSSPSASIGTHTRTHYNRGFVSGALPYWSRVPTSLFNLIDILSDVMSFDFSAAPALLGFMIG